MNRVEREITLPAGARPLDEYARYYASRPDGEIVGVYVVPYPGPSPEEICEGLMSGEEEPCPTISTEERRIAAGERLWMLDYRSLPSPSDGGCEVIEVRFRPAGAEPPKAFCHGHG